MKVVPFKQYYPSREMLNGGQRRCYSQIRKRLDRNKFVDLQGNISYLFLYIYEQLDSVVNSGLESVEGAIGKLLELKELYGHTEEICPYLDRWIGDLLCLKGDFFDSLGYYNLDPSSTLTALADHVLNLKYELKADVDAREILCTRKKLTKFGYEHIGEIVEYCNIILKREKEERGMDYVQYIGRKYRDQRKGRVSLFNGYPGGYDLNLLFNQQSYFFRTYHFPTITEFCEFGDDLSRCAEDALREDIGLPKVGEGWISETELYYRIKSYLPEVAVLNHYRPKWLGRQHLDVFIPSVRIAFEYQGRQHFEPIEYFGGEGALQSVKKRDRAKKSKCTKNGVRLFYVGEGYDFGQIRAIIDEYVRRRPR